MTDCPPFLQLSDNQPDDKSKKKKRLDDIMFGLGAAKGVQLEAAAAAAAAAAAKQGDEAAQTLLKSNLGKTADLSKLQEMLGPADAKVQKWLADQGRNSRGVLTFIFYSSITNICIFDQSEINRPLSLWKLEALLIDRILTRWVWYLTVLRRPRRQLPPRPVSRVRWCGHRNRHRTLWSG